MEPVLLGLALGAGALYIAKRGRGVMHSAVGWTARKSGWIASRVRSSLEETKTVAREQYRRGRVEAAAKPTTTSPTTTPTTPAKADASITASPAS